MEEFRRDLRKCYGQVRFRRTLKTPKAQPPTAAVTVIPLTKKKALASDANSGAKRRWSSRSRPGFRHP